MKIFIPLLFFSISIPAFLTAQWERQFPVAKLEQVLDLVMHGDGHGYAVGSDDLILRLNPATKTWDILLSWNQNWKLETVDYLAGSNGMTAVAGGPSLIMTVDGGDDWAQVTGPATGIHVIKMFSATDFMVIASNGIYRWRNNNWEDYSPVTSGLIGGFILDDQHYWAFTGGTTPVIHYTSNGGVNWNQNSNIPRPDVVKFYSAEYGIATDGRMIFKTLNGGQLWTLTSDNAISNTSADISFGNSGHILYAAMINANAAMSLDSGLTWSTIQTGSAGQRSFSIEATSDTEFWIGNDLSSILHTTNSGGSFIETFGPPRGTIQDIVFPNRGDNRLTGFAVGLRGLVMRTFDGGENWEDISTGDTRNYLSIDGYYAGDLWIGTNQRILHSTDLGETWQEKAVFISGNINDIHNSSSDWLLAVSSTGIIYRSPDNGESWDTVYQTTAQLKSVTATGGNEYMVTGFNGTILRSIDSGLTWQPVTPPVPGLQYEHGAFVAPEDLWIVSSSFTRQMWHSTDLGQTWDTIDLPVERFWDGVYFISPDTGVVVGHTNTDSRVYMTYSGGMNWESTYTVPFALQGVTGLPHPNGTMWIFGAGSDIERVQFCTDTATIQLVTAHPTPACEGGELVISASGTFDDLYNWYYPAGWSIISGERNDTITFLVNGNSGLVTVSAENACGQSLPKSVDIDVTLLPQMDGIAGPTVLCHNQAGSFTADADNANQFHWNVPAGWIVTGDSTSYTIEVLPTTPQGEITVYAENACGISAIASAIVTVFEFPEDLEFEISGDTLEIDDVFTTYQWLLNGVPIPGANGPSYIITESGSYSLEVTVAGCLELLGPEQVIFSSNEGIYVDEAISIYPSPATGWINLQGINDGSSYAMTNHLGLHVASGRVISKQVDVSGLPGGLYILYVSTGKEMRMGRFFKAE